jgi:hypothetical protein
VLPGLGCSAFKLAELPAAHWQLEGLNGCTLCVSGL